MTLTTVITEHNDNDCDHQQRNNGTTNGTTNDWTKGYNWQKNKQKSVNLKAKAHIRKNTETTIQNIQTNL